MISWQPRFILPKAPRPPIPMLPLALNSGLHRAASVPQNHFFYANPSSRNRFIMTEGCGPCVGLALWEHGDGGLVAHFDNTVLIGGNFNQAIFEIDKCIPLPSSVRIVTGGRGGPSTDTIIGLLDSHYAMPGIIHAAETDAILLDVSDGAAYLMGGNFKMREFALQAGFAKGAIPGMPGQTHFARIA